MWDTGVEIETTERQGARPRRQPSVADDGGYRLLIVGELKRLRGHLHERKKRNTILALIDARLAGTSQEDVWGRDDTCARSTWFEKWSKDPLIAEILQNCTEVADDWHDNRAAMALAETATRLMLEAPASLDTVLDVRDYAENDADRLRAAQDVLNRASSVTGTKSSQEMQVRMTADQFAAMQREAAAEAAQLEAEATEGWEA